MKKNLIFGMAILSMLTSCEEDIDVNIPSSGRKVVIEGSIENGKPAEVIITRNNPLFSTISGTTLADYMVLDARVYVSNGFLTDTLSIVIDTTASLPVVYKGHSMPGIPGQTYSLTVYADGKTFTSTTTIPAPVRLDSVWFKTQPPFDTLGYAWAHLTDPSGLGNSYRWLAKRPYDRRYIAPSSATTDDKWIDGTSFDFYYDKGTDPTARTLPEDETSRRFRGFYKVGDTIYVKFCTLDHESTLFYQTFEQSVSTNGNPFASPITILGNITSDGKEQLGVWAGFGVTYDTIYAY